jgi:hypothetical protein
MRFEDFVLHLDTSSRGGFRARVLKSPFGEGAVSFSLGDQSALRSRPPLDVGIELFQAVFQGQVRMLLDKCLGQLERSQDLGLRLKIKLDLGDEETAALADLPWELLCDGDNEDFLALSRQTSLVRYLDVPRSSQPIPFTAPLRILAVAASPRSLPALDLAEETRHLKSLNQSSSVEVQFLDHASAGAVREALSGDTFNVLHFMGHGVFDRASGEGMLAFEGADGSPDLVSGKAFATKLKDLRSLGLVVLNACDTARARNQEGSNPFRGVATALVLRGVPGVVAMQRPISDRAAIAFSTAFYRRLASGDSIDEALTEARQAIHSAKPDTFEWSTPVLFLRMPEGNVFVAQPVGPPDVIAPPSVPVSSKRGRMPKIAASAAGAALVSFALYRARPGSPAPSTNPLRTEPKAADTQSLDGSLTPSRARGKAEPQDSRGRRQAADPSTRMVRNALNIDPAPQPPQQAVAKQTLPVEVPPAPAEVEKPIAATASLSSLSAQVLSISRRAEGGLRVTVSFRNTADLPVSAVLDAESSLLSDEQGQRYSILDSDLPGSSPHLELAAGATSRQTFDFQAPKLGSKHFYLALLTQDGRPLKVAGSATLEGSP